jgi:hypothetical protein
MGTDPMLTDHRVKLELHIAGLPEASRQGTQIVYVQLHT